MISFPSAKLNIGLRVREKRSDGYHNIESILYPIPCWDALEVVTSSRTQLSCSGLPFPTKREENLVWRAYRLIASDYKLPSLRIHLHKSTPIGAGLGGGSANAAEMLLLLDRLFELNLTEDILGAYASKLGCDVPFFLRKCPQLAQGRGDQLDPLPYFLNGTYVHLLVPSLHINTAEAYEAIDLQAVDRLSLLDVLDTARQLWQQQITNDFQPWLFDVYPEVATLAEYLRAEGAWYVSLSGTGASVYGLFDAFPSSPTPTGVWSKVFLLE